MRHPALTLFMVFALAVVFPPACPVSCDTQPQLVLTRFKIPDEVCAHERFKGEIFYRSSLPPDRVESLIKFFNWQFEGADRKPGNKRKTPDECLFAVNAGSILVRTSIGKVGSACSIKMSIEYGEGAALKLTNTVASNTIAVREEPPVEPFLGEWAGTWEWTKDKTGTHYRDARLVVKLDSDNRPLAILTLGIAYSGSAKALLPREAMRARTREKHPELRRKNNLACLVLRMGGSNELELHLDNGKLVGGLTTARNNTKCSLSKVQ